MTLGLNLPLPNSHIIMFLVNTKWSMNYEYKSCLPIYYFIDIGSQIFLMGGKLHYTIEEDFDFMILPPPSILVIQVVSGLYPLAA